jgi:fibronectin type 3 domain-containing protein
MLERRPMGTLRRRRSFALFVLALLSVCVFLANARAELPVSQRNKLPGSAAVRRTETEGSIRLTQAAERVRIGVFTFDILNLGAAGYDATLSNLFMTLMDQHRIFEVMSRKLLEESLRREGLRQSGDLSTMRTVGTCLGLDAAVFGNVRKTAGGIEFEVKCVDVSQGELLLHRKEQVSGHAELRQKVEEITNQLARSARQHRPAPVMVQEEEEYPCLNQPDGLKARGGSRKVVLSWNASKKSNLRGYKVFRGNSPVGPFCKIGTVSENTFADTDIENNRTYYYKVKAYNQEGRESSDSAIIAAQTSLSPYSPIILDATPLIRGVRIRWTANPRQGEAGTEVMGFKIYRATEEEGEYLCVNSLPVEGGAPKLKKFEYEDSAIADGAEYYYQIAAFNNSKIEGEASSILKGNTVARPTGLVATGDMIREIHLHWDSTPFSEIAGYRLYRNSSAQGTYEQIAELQGKEKTTFIDRTNLADDTTYFYRITAYDNQGRETSFSATVSATTKGKPPVPDGLLAESGMVKRVKLEWQARPETEVEGYYIYWNNAEAGEFRQIGKVKGRDSTTFIDKGDHNRPLDDNGTYYYMITSYNKVDLNSNPTPVVSATTKPRPTTPIGLSAHSGLVATIILTWKTNPEPDIQYFHVHRKRGGEKFKEIEQVSSDKTRYQDSNLDHGTTYVYCLQAEDEDHLLSDPSDSAQATTKPRPKPPAGLKAKGIPNGFKLRWQPNPEPDIMNYKIYLRSFLFDKQIGRTDTVHFTTDTLKPDEEYTLQVTAIDKDGLESEKSEEVTVRTLGQ